jgi:micrococcal nuclease
MVPCPSALVPFLLLNGCKSLDDVPIAAGYHCAEDRLEEVAYVHDGDTFNVGDGDEAVRLLGVDAPEVASSVTEEECGGPEAAAWLALRLAGQQVELHFDVECTSSDPGHRTLAYAFLADEDGDIKEPSDEGGDYYSFLNEEIIRLGYARVYEEFDDIRLAPVLYAAEAAARREGNGIWGTCEK